MKTLLASALVIVASLGIQTAWAGGSCTGYGEPSCSITCQDFTLVDGTVIIKKDPYCINGVVTTYYPDGSIMSEGKPAYCYCS